MKVFISYSRNDEQWLKQLEVQLKPLEREGLIESWHDRMIPPGSEWEREIDHHLVSADIILLLVSADFVASRYCHEKELAVALYRHGRGEACVVPIIVRPVDLERAPFGKLQALPRDAKPVSTWPDPDEAWLDVQKELRRLVETLAQKRRQADNIATSARRRALRIAMLRGIRTQLGLLVAREAVRRAPTPVPELWSELASSITACPARPLPATLPEGVQQWVPSPDFTRALFWLLDRRGLIVDLRTGRVTAELDWIDGTPDWGGAQDAGTFSPDGTLIAAVRGQLKRPHTSRGTPSDLLNVRDLAVLGIWDSVTGKLLGRARSVQGRATFSTDGRQVLVDYAGDAALIGMDEPTLVSLSNREVTGLDRRGARSPDGRAILAVHTENRTAYIIRDGKAHALKGHEHRIIYGAWSPDGTRVLTCARDKTARIWSSDGKLQSTFHAHKAALTWGDWHPQGDCVATVAEDGSGWLWGTDGQPRCSLTPAELGPRFCQWSPTGGRLLVWHRDGGPLFVFDQKGRQLLELYDDLEGIVSPRWHPDGVTVYGLGAARKLSRWSTRQEPLSVLAPDGQVVAAEFMPGSATILTVDAAANQATLWDVRGEALISVPVPDAAQVKSVAPSPDGEHFLTVSRSEGVHIWSRDGKPAGALQGHAAYQGETMHAVWSPPGRRILTVSNDGAARIWDADGSPVAMLGKHYWGVQYGAFSSDGRLVLTVSGYETLRVWSAEPPFIPVKAVEPISASERENIPRRRSLVAFGSYDQDGVLEALPSGGGREVEQAARLLALWPYTVREKYVGRWPSFSPDGGLILLPSGRAVQVPAVTDEAAISPTAHPPQFALTLSVPHGEPAHDACFSPDGTRIATAHQDAARLWDRTGRLLRELKGHTASVWLVRFSPDSRRLLTVIDGGKILQLWDVATGRWLATLPGPPDSILHASFSADGRHVLAHAATTVPGLSAVRSGYVWIWPAALEGLTALADARAGRALTDDELQLYFDDAPEVS